MRTVVPAALLGLMLLFSPGDVSAQPISIFNNLVGEWNHISSGESVDIRRTGDVWITNAPLSRVADATEAGGNFSFNGRNSDNTPYRCIYYVTFLSGDQQTNWRLVASDGARSCPTGLFTRVSALQAGAPPPALNPTAPVPREPAKPSEPRLSALQAPKSTPPAASASASGPPPASEAPTPSPLKVEIVPDEPTGRSSTRLTALPNEPLAPLLSTSPDTREFQRELKRLGCYVGGRPNKPDEDATSRAFRRYIERAGLEQEAAQTPELLERLRGETRPICAPDPAPNGVRRPVRNVRACARGEHRDRDGDCAANAPVRRRLAHVEDPAGPLVQPRRPKQRPTAAPRIAQRCFTHRGQSFCE